VKRSRDTNALISIGIVGLIILFGAPQTLDLFGIISLTTAVSLAILALSLGLIWGFGGILCFGQTAFFGIGAYAYAIAALNFGGSTGAIVLAIVVAGAAAAVLGYFMFYGRLSDVYLAQSSLAEAQSTFTKLEQTPWPRPDRSSNRATL